MDETPAWMACEDILSRIHAELMSEALELLHREIESGNIKVDGDLVTSGELTGETERELFILERLLGDEENMRLRYENMVRAVEEGKETNPEIVARMEAVKKFLLVVSQISMTVKYAKVFESWFNDAGSNMRATDPAEIIYLTAKDSDERKDALEFAITNKTFIKNEALKPEEFNIIKNAYQRCIG